MSGGATPSSYSTLRRGLKATTSKLMGAASVKRPPSHIPSTLERTGSERGDPGRFVEGVSFKGKLIGVLEVSEARGDRMCQEALAELKIAVRAAGEHKQRIAISVAMDGIRLTDERTGDCLHHHPVHKISFIAQDMTDTRAFGYIFGSPDAGHKFFGIKTEKAASQVVIAMRDLFQVVFERKKKEIEKARAQLEEGRDGVDFKEPSYGALFGANGEPGIVSASLTSGAGGAIADLLDLQSELTSLQRGLSEISKRTQSLQKQQSHAKEEHFDPFGDSFKPGVSSSSSSVEAAAAPPKPRITASSAPTPAPLAPPPISGRSRHDSQRSQQQHLQKQKSSEFTKFPVDFRNITKPSAGQSPSDRYAAFKDIHPAAQPPEDEEYDEADVHRKSIGSTASGDSGRKEEFDVQWSLAERQGDARLAGVAGQSGGYDIFTDLDPLGTGKIKPFVDKKDFFNDVRKQTAKKLLRGMGDGEESLPGSPKVQPGVIPPEVSALVASSSLYNTSANASTISSLKLPATSTHTTPSHNTVMPAFSDSFASTQTTTFQDSFTGGQSSSREHLDASSTGTGGGGAGGGFADFNRFTDSPRSQRSDFSSGSVIDEPAATSLSVGSLTVALPPESFRDSPPPFSPPPPPHTLSRSASGSNSPQPAQPRHSPVPRNRLLKQTTVPNAPPLSPKTLPRSHKFARQNSYEAGWENAPYFPSIRGGPSEIGVSSASPGEGGISPRPRPRSSLSKQLRSGSATLPLRGSFGKGSLRSSSPSDFRCRPFPSEETSLGFDEAPEPPPRPAHVEPPPLPPKRLPSHITLRPPPRPPTTSEPHYNYINDYDSSPDDSNAMSPPIPIPARKPRFPESSHTPTTPAPSLASIRSNKPPPSLTDGFHFPKTNQSPTRDLTLGAVPKTSSRGSTPSKSSTPGKSPRTAQRGLTPESVDLTNTSLDQLASKLNVPVEQLAKMTVVELAACLAQLQLRSDSGSESTRPQSADDGYEVPIPSSATVAQQRSLSEEKQVGKRSRTSSNEWSNDKFAFDDEEMFARFDAQFPKSPVDAPDFPPSESGESKTKFPLGAPVSEDRYAVFRELSSSGKQKSVFDENLLTPQNSMEEEASEVSSGTFKANFHEGFHQDSLERKSSLSDDLDATELRSGKDWEPSERIDHECVTVFRSPDISEYENFEPNFECKFEDDFSTATLSEKSVTPINFPPVASEPSPSSVRSAPAPSSIGSQKSPFTDDFSKVSDVTVFSEAKYAKISKDDKFVANFNDSSSSLGNGRVALFSEGSTGSGGKRRSTSTFEKSPFEDDFSEYHIKQRAVDDSSIDEKYDNVFESDCERRSKRIERTSKRRSKKSSSSLDAPNGTPLEKTSESPFDDDFSQRTSKYEVLRDLDAERSSPFDDPDDQKSIGSLPSAHEDPKSSLEQRSSPYSETLTPPSYSLRSRGPSRVSMGSEGSAEVRQSPFDDNFTLDNNGSKGLLRELQVIETVSQEDEEDEDRTLKTTTSETKTADEEDDEEEKKLQNGDDKPESNFADFETAFQAGKISFDATAATAPALTAAEEPPEEGITKVEEEDYEDDDEEEEKRKKDNDDEPSKEEEEDRDITFLEEEEEEDEEVFPQTETEFRISARYPKTQAENIFRRNSDPFSDDFFDETPHAEGASQQPNSSSKTPKNSFWEEPFGNFKFNNG